MNKSVSGVVSEAIAGATGPRGLKRAWWVACLVAAPTWLSCQAAEYGLGSNDSPAKMRSAEDHDAQVPAPVVGKPALAVTTDGTPRTAADAGVAEVNGSASNLDAGSDTMWVVPGPVEPEPATVEEATDPQIEVFPGVAPTVTANPNSQPPSISSANAEGSDGGTSGQDGGLAAGVVLEDLPGCEREQVSTQDAGLCRQDWTCPEGTFSTTCVRWGADWSCDRDSRNESFLLEDHGALHYVTVSNVADITDACNTASLALEPGRQDPYTGPEDCETITGCTEASCYENKRCGPALRAEGGVEIRQGAAIVASCYGNVRDNGDTSCFCSGYGPNDQTVYVAPGDLSTIRDEFAEFCRNPEPASPTGPTMCSSSSSSVEDANYCSDYQECLTPYQTAEGTALLVIGSLSIDCYEGECSCVGDAIFLSVDVAHTADPRGDCLQALDICKGTQNVDNVGPVQDCQVRGEGLSSDIACQEVVDCTAAATFGGSEVTVPRSFPVECDLSAATPHCTCLNSESTVLAEVEVAASDDAPCRTAAPLCRDIIEGTIGE